MIESIPRDWLQAMNGHIGSVDLAGIEGFVAQKRLVGEVYPPAGMEFQALRLTPFKSVRAVILGQDPYPNRGQACGLAFSVPKVLEQGVRRPQSLGRILSELRLDGYAAPKKATLESWANSGVLLLNTALTVCSGKPGSHADIWKPFTTAVIGTLVDQPEPIAFLLWGEYAKQWSDQIRLPHKAICSPHPAARGKPPFFASTKPFSRANAFLGSARQIDWNLG